MICYTTKPRIKTIKLNYLSGHEFVLDGCPALLSAPTKFMFIYSLSEHFCIYHNLHRQYLKCKVIDLLSCFSDVSNQQNIAV